MITCRRADNQALWETTLPTLPLHHVLQSWAWGEFKARWGWSPLRLIWYRGQEPVAAAQVLFRPISPTPLRMAYVPKGPALDPADEATVVRVLEDLERLAASRRCAFIKVDPDVPAGHPVFVPALRDRGWQFSPEQVQFRNTALLDLTPDEEALLATMRQKTRYNIRLARRRGVEVKEGGPEALPLFYAMYRETAQRDGFLIRPAAYYLDVWADFLGRGMAHLLLAWYGGEPIAGLMLFRYGHKVWYFYGASTAKHRNTMPNYLLQWEAIRWAKAQGALVYDLWGAPDRLEEDDPLWGVWRFKRGFGARFQEQIGAWDYAPWPPLYRLLTGALPALRRLWRAFRPTLTVSAPAGRIRRRRLSAEEEHHVVRPHLPVPATFGEPH